MAVSPTVRAAVVRWVTEWYETHVVYRFSGEQIADEMPQYGIKLSIDSGLTGDVVLEAKTTSLAKHYEEDFGAVLLPTFQSSAPRYLIADEAAKRIFFTYLD